MSLHPSSMMICLGSSLSTEIYLLLEAELKALQKFLDNNLHSGFITSSGSPFSAPVLFVKKSRALCLKASVYTKLKLHHAYYLVRITDGDEWKTAFHTRYGSYQWNVIPEGLTNAPAAFQHLVNLIFTDLLDICVVIYLNDILIYSKNMDNHEKHVKKVLWQLKKNIKWNWGLEAQKAFVDLKEAFTQAPVLTHWEPDQLITIKTDASDYAVAAILSITLSNSELHPVVFLSRTLMGAELNYDTHDKELLAIFEVFKTWHHYLEGALNPIDIVTNHKNLKYFSTTKILTRRQPGRLGAKPDALTRCWDVYPKEGDTSYMSVNPQNFQLIFTEEQLISSLQATYLEEPVL
uniref:Reverse transcriptase domain-containing protein n=1 Tax=Moniliophthora roreri TaxID=221103 RepID=A0A0W0GFH2_MONRR